MGYPLVPLKKITDQVLRERGACGERFDFTRVFPDGARPTFKIANEHYMDFNWGWAGTYLLDAQGSALYISRVQKSHDECSAAIRTAHKWYYKDFERYDRIVGRATKKHRRFQARLFVELFREHPILVEDRSHFDSSETLTKLRGLVRRVEEHNYSSPYAVLDSLVDSVKELDEWMSHGGRKPKEWMKSSPRRQIESNTQATAA